MFVFAAIALSASALASSTSTSLDLTLPTGRVEPAAVTAASLSSVAVTVECTAHRDGRVSDCRVLDETHPGMGFGDAAIALVQDSRVEARARDAQFARTIQFMP